MFLIDRFRKKAPPQEEAEPYLPPDLEGFRSGVIGKLASEPSPIPERERRFRAFAREMENPRDIGTGFGENAGNSFAEKSAPENGFNDTERLDMILQKLETIDLRLKLIEQKMERSPV